MRKINMRRCHRIEQKEREVEPKLTQRERELYKEYEKYKPYVS